MLNRERIEGIAQLAILLAVATMAGAASFTHVHDWTMTNSPQGTGDWFGWANAVISELTPTAAALEIRRRKRHHGSIGYPMAVLVLAAGLSISAQLAVATPTPVGWLLSAVPALAFLALTKLVLSTPTQPAHLAATDTGTTVMAMPVDLGPEIAPGPQGEITAPDESIDADAGLDPTAVPDELLTSARMADFSHRQAHGQSITTAALADYLGITTELAAVALHHLHGETIPSPSTGGRR
ncbi:hypothetical protein [Actinomadura rupiterrae]|uniref:hypothetical protein n=1 Tax=Actinomadura rupiterrae TaxID=559627 RepID=UPI0020A2FEE7|nr:hypothetical protein [Actinomadura rupiterrae]MCP2341017.1 hypothetical protein [Actinomadura rupiterrae]